MAPARPTRTATDLAADDDRCADRLTARPLVTLRPCLKCHRLITSGSHCASHRPRRSKRWAANVMAAASGRCERCGGRADEAHHLYGLDSDAGQVLHSVRAGGRVAPKMLEELSGTGLLTHSGTVLTTS